MVKKIGLAMTLLLLALMAYAGWTYYQFAFMPASKSSKAVIIDVAPGVTLHSLQKQFQDHGIIMSSLAIKIWSRQNPSSNRLKIGEYEINTSWSGYKILAEIVSGRPLLRKVVVKEGFHIWDIQEMLIQSGLLKNKEDYLALVTKKEYLNRFKVPVQKISGKGLQPTIEGFLFPETYSYQKYDNAETLVKAMLNEFEARALPILREHPWGQTPEGIYRLVTLASIVEKESGDQAEQPLIASVFWNRIHKKMKLQSDPTTIYALLPIFDGNITREHLRTPTPYNTYTLPELPIGPISNPGDSALRAVVNPAESSYLFFVSRGDGTHVFSETYKQHDQYVKEYQLKRRQGVSAGSKQQPKSKGQ